VEPSGSSHTADIVRAGLPAPVFFSSPDGSAPLRAPLCPACGLRPGISYYGLCVPCSKKPENRRRPQRAKQRGRPCTEWGSTDESAPPSTPTSALPKTEAKLAVMAARAARRERLDHVNDAGARPLWQGEPPAVNELDQLVAQLFASILRKSLAKSVYVDRKKGRAEAWVARPWRNRKRYSLGRYQDEFLAGAAVVTFDAAIAAGQDPAAAAARLRLAARALAKAA
jgi:hypothetical protein